MMNKRTKTPIPAMLLIIECLAWHVKLIAADDEPAPKNAPAANAEKQAKQLAQKRLDLMKKIQQQRLVLLERREVLDSKVLALRNQILEAEGEAAQIVSEAVGVQVQIGEARTSIDQLKQEKASSSDRLVAAQYDQAIEQRRTEGRALERQFSSLNAAATRVNVKGRGLMGQVKDATKAMEALYNEADQLRIEWLSLVDPFGHLNREEHEEALLTFDEWIVQDGENAGAFVARGFAYWRLGELDKALADFQRGVDLGGPMLPTVLAARGGLFHAMGRSKEGQADFGKALKLEKRTTLAYLLRGISEISARKWRAAEADFKIVIRLNKRDAEAYRQLSMLQSAYGPSSVRNGSQAVKNARQACELTKWKDSFSIDSLAIANAENGDFEQAVTFARQAADLAWGENRDRCLQHATLFESEEPLRLDAEKD